MSTAPTGQQKPQNVRQADSSQPDRPQPNAEPSQPKACGDAPGAATVKTTDPVVNSGSERQARWNEHPERAITLETNPAEGATPDAPLGEPRDVVESKAAASGGRRGIAPDEPAGHEPQPDAGRAHAEEKLRHDQPGDLERREHGDKPRKQHERGGRERDEHQRRHHQRSHHDRDHHDRDHHDGHHHPRKKKKHKHHEHAATAPTAPGWKTLLMTGVLALVCGVAGAWGYSYFAGDSSKADEQSQQGGKKDGEKSGGGKSSGKKSGGGKDKSGGSSEQGDEAASPRQIPEFTSADDAETLKKQIKHLDDRIDRLSQRIDRVTTPEEETPPVLGTLQIQMSDLAKEVSEVANLPSQVHQLEQRLASVIEQMKTMRVRRASSTASFDAGEPSDANGASLTKSPVDDESSPDGEATPPAPIDDDTGVADATLDLAIGLFQEGQYPQARQVLVRLQRARPQDARVWYYSALTNGLTTGVWDGETKMLLDKAIKRERAGTPSRAQVDAALAGVKADQGKSWLARQRQPVAKSKSHRNY